MKLVNSTTAKLQSYFIFLLWYSPGSAISIVQYELKRELDNVVVGVVEYGIL